MRRRTFLHTGWVAMTSFAAAQLGCRNKQVAHILSEDDKDMVGSHTAGAETWEPLIQTSVGQLLGRQEIVLPTSGGDMAFPLRKKICFAGVENKSSEEIGDFKAQIYQKIDSCINSSESFEVINQRYVEAGLRQCGLRPDDLFVPNSRRMFVATMEKLEQPFDYLLFATITSGTTRSNEKNYQRDYLLTLELVNLDNGTADKESAEIRKGYHKSQLGKLKNYG
ncbi:hypothetical protein Plim_1667 [Planctopirus limnophila DSM 3776]|uniref:Penicillin-binding protein activator LpoB n=1 Tax=Planctopirus limnophila (strain ATCC 43296 / DSM 3776 / IFAM 1008 / Mu 290) TaxID=521674 RepID=D5SWZ8_PLAL2|nr:hypothetical protein [Planctopirus limnophila]ADG67498.1 hypothetical protein Plim_1667 [Planctopirus limnophila DSM 3776]